MREGERKRAKRRKLKRNEKPQRFIHRKIDHLYKAFPRWKKYPCQTQGTSGHQTWLRRAETRKSLPARPRPEHTHIHACIYVHTRTAYRYVHTRTHSHACIHTYTCIHVHTYIHAYMHVYKSEPAGCRGPLSVAIHAPVCAHTYMHTHV